jgi:hypothetical protein
MLAFEAERNQVENVLGLKGLVALTDHDNIEAPVLLMVEETKEIPFGLEWTVPVRHAALRDAHPLTLQLAI